MWRKCYAFVKLRGSHADHVNIQHDEQTDCVVGTMLSALSKL